MPNVSLLSLNQHSTPQTSFAKLPNNIFSNVSATTISTTISTTTTNKKGTRRIYFYKNEKSFVQIFA